MYFTLHKPQLESTLSLCQKSPAADPIQPLLCAGLHSILRHCALYDACIMPENPFLTETESYLTCLNDDERFSFLECLIIFLREKALRQPGRSDEEEYRVLRYFEQSGEWAPDDGTLISLWYWVRLPQCCQNNGTYGL